jgi:hypothetical protein
LRYRFALRGAQVGQVQHLHLTIVNFAEVGEIRATPRNVNRPHLLRLRWYGSRRKVSRLFCIVSSEEKGTAAAPPMRALPSNSWPLLAEEREASGFRPAVCGLVGCLSTGAEWLTAIPDFNPTAFRFSLLMC